MPGQDLQAQPASSNPWAAPVHWKAPAPDKLPPNPWAVVAMITGSLALVPVAVVAAVTALVQIRRRPGRGTGLAVGGFVASVVWMLLAGLIALGFLLEGSGAAAGSGGFLGRVADVEAPTRGECLLAPAGVGSYAARSDCNEPHLAEVSAVVELSSDRDFPGYDELDGLGDDRCRSALHDYVGRSYLLSKFEYGWFTPDEAEWRGGERRIVCVITPGESDDELNGSVQGSRL